MAATPLQLVAPSLDHVAGYAEALRQGWSPNNLRDVSAEQLAALERDAPAFLADLTSRTGTIRLPDGTTVPKLPSILRWLSDGEFCGSISLRWQDGTDALPDHVLGHIGYAVVPWKRRRGYARAALAAILPEARRVGLTEVQITCDPGNQASMRVIEANGGRFVGRFLARHYDNKPELRYVIPLAPLLVTARLTLSPIEASDWPDLAALAGHPEVGGKLSHGVLDAEAARRLFDGYRATWTERGYGMFTLHRRDDGAFVGLAGLWDRDDDLGTALRYAVMPEHRGQGFAKEAAEAVLAFARRRGMGALTAVTRETNAASRRILADLGFALREIRERPGRRVAVYSKPLQDPS